MYIYIKHTLHLYFPYTYLHNSFGQWRTRCLMPLIIKKTMCYWQELFRYSEAITDFTCENMAKKSVAIERHLNILHGSVLVLLLLTPCSHGDSKFMPTKSVPKGTISVNCNTIPCRSAVDVAIQCDRLSTCWGLPDAVYPGHNCSMCTCPADTTTFNDVGIAYLKEIQITPFLKGKDYNVLYWMIFYHVSCRKINNKHELNIKFISITTVLAISILSWLE